VPRVHSKKRGERRRSEKNISGPADKQPSTRAAPANKTKGSAYPFEHKKNGQHRQNYTKMVMRGIEMEPRNGRAAGNPATRPGFGKRKGREKSTEHARKGLAQKLAKEEKNHGEKMSKKSIQGLRENGEKWRRKQVPSNLERDNPSTAVWEVKEHKKTLTEILTGDAPKSKHTSDRMAIRGKKSFPLGAAGKRHRIAAGRK